MAEKFLLPVSEQRAYPILFFGQWKSLGTCTKITPPWQFFWIEVQSTLVISKSKGPTKTLPDIRTSTYQICSIEEKTIRTTNFHKWLCNLTPIVRNIYWKYCGKGEKFLLFSTIFCNLILDFCVKTRTKFSLWDKRLFEITEVEITRVDCIHIIFE